MNASNTLISFLLIALLLALAHPQEAQNPTGAAVNSIPAVPVDTIQAQASQPDQSGSLSAQGNQTPASPAGEVHPASQGGSQAQPNVAIPQDVHAANIQAETVSTSANPSGAQAGGYQKKINPNPEDASMKQAIKKMIAEMTEQQLQAFQRKLSGDARHYYDQLLAEEAERDAAEDKWEDAELHQMEEEGELSPSETQRRKETQDFDEQWEKAADRERNFNEYLFQLNKGQSEDFRFSIPVAQQVDFYGYTYENNDGVYSVPSDIEDQQPLWVYVYENNHRIVFQKQFYFKYFGSFHGNQNSSYLIRFVNPSKEKLIALNLAVLFEIGHSADKLTAVDVADHGRRVKEIRQEVLTRFHDAHTKEMFASQNRGQLTVKLDRYFGYSIIEILIIVVLCVLQVEFVRKLLASTSVV